MPPRAIVIYDDDCGFCRWVLALLLALDRPPVDPARPAVAAQRPLNRPPADSARLAPAALRPLPLGTAEADYLLHDLTPVERDASWHLVIDPPGAGQLSFDAPPARFSAGAALAPALDRLPRGRRLARLLAHVPGPTERAYRWVADHRGPLGHLVPARARRWAGRTIAAHAGRPLPW